MIGDARPGQVHHGPDTVQRTRLQPAGAYAANILGLSEQVPAKAVFLTDGPSRTVKIGPTTIQLRRTTPRNMAAARQTSCFPIWVKPLFKASTAAAC